MLICNLGIYLGYLMTIYFKASLYYLITTKNIFKHHFMIVLHLFQKSNQAPIRKYKRTIFIKGILLGVFSCIWFQPFSKCEKLKIFYIIKFI